MDQRPSMSSSLQIYTTGIHVTIQSIQVINHILQVNVLLCEVHLLLVRREICSMQEQLSQQKVYKSIHSACLHLSKQIQKPIQMYTKQVQIQKLIQIKLTVRGQNESGPFENIGKGVTFCVVFCLAFNQSAGQ